MNMRIWFIVCLMSVVGLPLRVLGAETTETKQGISGCVTCHAGLEDEEMARSVKAWHQSVHKTAGIGCQDCHGGSPRTMVKEQAHDPKAGYIGTPDPLAVPTLCGKCHQTQRDNYTASPHGTTGGFNPTCSDCHSDHKVIPANVVKISTPKRCGDCHVPEILDQFKTVVVGVLTPIDHARQAAAALKSTGVATDPINAGADLAKDAFLKKVSHVFVLKTITPRADSLKVSLKKVEANIQAARAQVSIRRKFGSVAAVFLVVLAGIMLFYRRSLTDA